LTPTSRIAKNTIALYTRQILIMLVSLYTVRIVLNVLGVDDYGIYNVVAGVVTMLNFLGETMASASQRFFSVELGLKNISRLEQVFKTSLLIYLIIAGFILLLGETIGLWFTTAKLVIPEGRLNAALWVYQFSVLGFIFTMLSTPYTAMILANEDMNIYAYISIVESFLKLAIVFVLQLISIDKLILYGILLFCVSLIKASIFFFICMKKYPCCKSIGLYWNKKQFQEISHYTGWNFLGTATGMFRNQGITVLLNQFTNPAVVAARSISMQVNAAVSSFSNNFLNALNPQIIKNYASNEKQQMTQLVITGSKAAWFLVFLFSFPLYLEMPIVLQLWLKEIPDYTVQFTRLILIDMLINSISYPLVTLAMATGKIKAYEIILSSINMMGFVLAWVALSLGYVSASVFMIAIVLDIIMFFIRLAIVSRLANFPYLQYIKSVLLPVLAASLIAVILPLILIFNFQDNIIRLALTIVICIASLAVSVWFIGLSPVEKGAMRSFIKSKVGIERNV
jgi:O-antigen/teichoic acid export membrane protein